MEYKRAKLEILKKCFNVWLTIWNKQRWISNEWYVLDLFAGKGKYEAGKDTVSGSPLVFLEAIVSKIAHLEKRKRNITLILVERNRRNFKDLENHIDHFMEENRSLRNLVKIKRFNRDCNKIIDQIIDLIPNTDRHPLFVFVDPTGLHIKKHTMGKIVDLKNPKDIIFNYILEAVTRTSGIAKKAHHKGRANTKDLKTMRTLKEFIGEDIDIINTTRRKILEAYVDIFTSNNLNVIGYDMRYPNRNDILYYLLFAVRSEKVANIIKDIYGKQKEKELGPTLFGGKEFYIGGLFNVIPPVVEIKRKSLLYKTKVEYGDWTINHTIGCAHGCKFPCYAMMMAKKFGWVKNYKAWRKPKIAKNYIELLEKEIPKYRSQIDFVHLCFMSDPFMYDSDKGKLIPQVKEMTLRIIEKLNKEGIRVTTLTKGFYPDEILDKKRFCKDNEYGVTLVSLNQSFKERFEPYSAPYKLRVKSLRKLAENGLKTWVSLEPYPTPELDERAEHIEKILETVSFVNKIIFGKLNYRRLKDYTSANSFPWKNNEEFYRLMARKVIDFCARKNIKYHIKFGTPLSKNSTRDIFKD